MKDLQKLAMARAIAAEMSDHETLIDQTKYPKPDWAVHQLIRSTGLIEDVCEHGVGHPNESWMLHQKFSDPDYKHKQWGVHGCDGCCKG